MGELDQLDRLDEALDATVRRADTGRHMPQANVDVVRRVMWDGVDAARLTRDDATSYMAGASARPGTSSGAPGSASRLPKAGAGFSFLATPVRSRAAAALVGPWSDPAPVRCHSRGAHPYADHRPGHLTRAGHEGSIGNRSDPVSDTLILGVGWTNEKTASMSCALGPAIRGSPPCV
jgi:hypothetical protein